MVKAIFLIGEFKSILKLKIPKDYMDTYIQTRLSLRQNNGIAKTTMKKLKRNAEKFDVLELFANMAAEYGYDLRDPAAKEDFVKRVRESINASKGQSIAIHGRRTEALFAYIVGALGKAVLIKQEDSGDIFFSGTEVLAPDYRVTFSDQKQLLIEVKNCHHEDPTTNMFLKKDYYKKLKQYAELNGVELKFAVLFSRWNIWTLLSINIFEEHKNSYSINLLTAVQYSEMATLGDVTIATTPDLELHLFTNRDEASLVDDAGLAKFVLRDIKVYCAGHEVINEKEKKIAFFLIHYGKWPERHSEAIINDNKLLGMKFVYSPEEQEEPNFAFIGSLSMMITNAYRAHTVIDGDVVALKVGFDPSAFQILIPHDYKGEQLPLWRFVMSPKQD